MIYNKNNIINPFFKLNYNIIKLDNINNILFKQIINNNLDIDKRQRYLKLNNKLIKLNKALKTHTTKNNSNYIYISIFNFNKLIEPIFKLIYYKNSNIEYILEKIIEIKKDYIFIKVKYNKNNYKYLANIINNEDIELFFKIKDYYYIYIGNNNSLLSNIKFTIIGKNIEKDIEKKISYY